MQLQIISLFEHPTAMQIAVTDEIGKKAYKEDLGAVGKNEKPLLPF